MNGIIFKSPKILLFVILILLMSMNCNETNKIKRIKLGHGLDTNHPVHKAMVFMAERIEKQSTGRIKIDIYSSQQLGSQRECLELLQLGSLGMTKVSSSVLESFAPEFEIFALPYLFRNDDHRFKVYEGEIGRDLLHGLVKYRLMGLGYYDAGNRSFYTRSRLIQTPEDMTGLKLRTQESAMAIALVNTLGGAATPISWGELYTSLQQGVVDGAENNLPSLYTSRHYEVCKYLSMDEHTSIPDVILISHLIWEKLSKIEKKIIQDAVDASVKYQKEIWQDETKFALKKIQDSGVKIIYPDKAAFIKKIEPIYKSYIKKRGGSLLLQIKGVK